MTGAPHLGLTVALCLGLTTALHGQPDPAAAARPSAAHGESGCQLFFTETAFFEFNFVQGSKLIGTEDFEFPTTDIAFGDIVFPSDPLRQGVTNAGFPDGLATPFLTIQSNEFFQAAPFACPSGFLAGFGQGAFDGTFVPNSVKVGPAGKLESLDLLFDLAAQISIVGFTVENGTGNEVVEIVVHDLQNQEILSQSMAVVPFQKSFFGMVCDQGIGRINVGGPGFVMVDDIQLWEPPKIVCPWDCGEPSDGQVGINDFLAVLGTWGEVGAPCDFDGDGVGITDFLKILGTWGSCADCVYCDVCGVAGTGDCCAPGATAGCEDPFCCETVCRIDPFCCDVEWDALCVGTAQAAPVCGCSSALSGAATLYGSNRNGNLFIFDPATGITTFVGGPVTAAGATEIEYDNLGQTAFAQRPDGGFAGNFFDIATGQPNSPSVPNGAAYNGLEYVGSTLYGTAILASGAPSELRTLDPATGNFTLIGVTGVGPISGLAYDINTETMYGIAGGPPPAMLYTINLQTGLASVVGDTGIQAGSLEFGPDGHLYAGGTGFLSAGTIFRLDPATGEVISATDISCEGVTGLMLVVPAPESPAPPLTPADD